MVITHPSDFLPSIWWIFQITNDNMEIPILIRFLLNLHSKFTFDIIWLVSYNQEVANGLHEHLLDVIIFN